MKKINKWILGVISALFALLPINTSLAQHTGNGGSIPWIVLDSKYDTSPFNDTTKVDVWFDGSSYTGAVTSVQFKVKYDGATFTKVYDVVNNLDTSKWTISFNDNTSLDEVLISLVYTSTNPPSIADTSFVTIKLQNVHNKLIYNNQQNITPFTFAGYQAIGSNSNSADIQIGTFSHGGVVNIPHRKFSGYVKDVHTLTGIPNLEYRLQRDNTTVATVLGGQPTKTSNAGYYEMVYYEYFYGYINESTTDFDFFFKTEDIDSDVALSTADAYKLLLYANNKETFNHVQKLQGDVNHSHTLTIADAQAKFAYQAGTYSGWSTLGQGGYRDVMIIKPEDMRYLITDTLAVTNLGIGPLGFEPQNTNWTYDLNAYNGISDLTEDFYAVIMGDVNGTSIGGTTPAKEVAEYPIAQTQTVDTSILAQLPDKEVVVGDEFFVDLVLNTREIDVHSFDFELKYDPEVLEFINASTPYLPNAWMLYFQTDELGRIDYGGMDGSSGDFPIRTDTLETIIRFKFKAINTTGIGETPIMFGNQSNTGDTYGDDLTTIVKDGKVYMQVVSSTFDTEEFPKGFRLDQNYPNPFNPSTVIPFTIVSPQQVSIDVYRVDGSFVRNLYNKFTSTGKYEVTFDANDLPSGLYVYKLTSDKGVDIKKLTLIK